ncbi:hypothetical protein COX86_03710 [Candidatus Micrarchaeota archaeon CG_4_10_14_0_2_um_filter_60_11]|nr:MAG: hypothetical protein AUJ16_02390 [Candidatus Micrarchaeota archaeon CG1_02_60_51]PIN96594.1 MAG: hypothetical protein COU39_00630 [Candidatus Micrarchaeota archaeon CG10_big_fil_rev_8_21_14_0_10_60_32]PIO02181.1 MAG: hypothetical protein COT58_01225 [Candidatus Micrarchaeota archaeon CG09_land_8_20_14_0_10_60_16]PIY91378.1 MAG: hypothetical protein COY71_03480 [Candidatus Micrarchaeota archaeon CG_4_10_14_0_8_um_filter_60_7]PIZ90650.1 MAG: hypothetical protein COX86_03710 [Candidatus Mi
MVQNLARKKKDPFARLAKFRQLEFLIAGGAVVAFVFLVAAYFVQPGTQQSPPDWGVNLTIDNGGAMANSPKVLLYLSSSKARDCRYSNSDGIWTDFETPAADARQWTLSPGDGLKVVRAVCRASDASERSAEASILLDSTPPEIVLLKLSGVTNSEFEASFKATDNIARTLACSMNLDAIKLDLGRVASNAVKTKALTASQGTHSIKVECTDDAGNRGEAIVSFTVEALEPNANNS